MLVFFVGLMALVLFWWMKASILAGEVNQLAQSVQQLEQDKRNLLAAYEYLSTERDRLDRLYAENRKENTRVQSILERQLEALRTAEADPCADVPVSADRIQWLRQPVWIDTPHAVPGDS
jgi:uncharacterized protein YlxW (UPF0749 family)